jgi:hypothetical protein
MIWCGPESRGLITYYSEGLIVVAVKDLSIRSYAATHFVFVCKASGWIRHDMAGG